MPLSPGRRIEVSERHPDNRGVLAYLRTGNRDAAPPLSARPGDVTDPYYQLGTHPDVVEHVWDVLGSALTEDCRCVVSGCIALVQPNSGVVLALGLGTTYAVRFSPADAAETAAAGLNRTHRYRTSGDGLDLEEWGEGWLFGAYDRREPEWLRRAFEYYASAAS